MKKLIAYVSAFLLVMSMCTVAQAKPAKIITSLKQSTTNASQTTSFKLKLKKKAKTTARIYNSKGKLISTILKNKSLKKGTSSFKWDWKTSKKEYAPKGKYTLKVTAKVGKSTNTKKLKFSIKPLTLLSNLAPENDEAITKVGKSLLFGGSANEGMLFDFDKPVVYSLNKKYKALKGVVGVRSTDMSNNLSFLNIYGDGKLLFESTEITSTYPCLEIELDISDVDKLEIVARRTIIGFNTAPVKPGLFDCVLE